MKWGTFSVCISTNPSANQANKERVLLTDHFPFWWAQPHWKVWWGWKLSYVRKSCAMAFSHQIAAQLNTYSRFWSNGLESVLQNHHQNTNWTSIFWKNAASPNLKSGHGRLALLQSIWQLWHMACLSAYIPVTFSCAYDYIWGNMKYTGKSFSIIY